MNFAIIKAVEYDAEYFSNGFLGSRHGMKWLKHNHAAALIGYGIVVALIAMVSLVSVQGVGIEVERIFSLGANSIQSGDSGGSDVPGNEAPVWVTEPGFLGAYANG
jgi:Flp pilus assembly pilin Flp